jgi:dTDP-4-amino-4,6-dideoxygalactose transaminase
MTSGDEIVPLTRPVFGDEELALVRECLMSGWVTQGPMTRRLEEIFAERHEVRHALACANCTAGLHVAVLALDLGPGDEVIVPAFTWTTSAHAAEYVGARPVFCDVDPLTYNIDVASMEAALTPRTRAVMPVHLFGLAADMAAVEAVARRHGLAVIEDAACAVGTRYQGRPVGRVGSIGCFSLHPRKIVTTGEGGMITTQDDRLAGRLRRLRNHGAGPAVAQPRPFDMGPFDELGFNYRLSDIQAAVGVAQMARLDALIRERRTRAARYTELLQGIAWVIPPEEPDGYFHTYQSYVVRVTADAPIPRNEMMIDLEKRRIQTRPGTLAVHATGYYRDKYKLRPEDFPVSWRAQEQTMTLPLFPGMTDEQQDRVAKTLRAFGA